MGADELELVRETFASNWIAPLGPQVDAFEREFAARVGSPNATALSSGTAALHLALRWLKLQAGDEVICSALTFSASVNPVLYERATPVFVDSDRSSWNMDPACLAEAVHERIKRGVRPKAVILVHLYGQSADIDPIARICGEHAIPLVEDAAEALGAVYWGAGRGRAAGGRENGMSLPAGGAGAAAPVSRVEAQPPVGGPAVEPGARVRDAVAPGTIGLAGVFSFNGNKIITTSGGGMLVSSDRALIDKARFWATQARDPAPHYEHSEVGFNYRLSNVLAAIGRGQLRVLDQRIEARRRNFAYYERALGDLPGLAFMPEAPYGRSTRWLTCMTIDPPAAGTDRERVRRALAAEEIEARPVWKPMHLQPLFKECRCFGGNVAASLFEHGLCLPSGSSLTTSDLDRVIEVVRRAFAAR